MTENNEIQVYTSNGWGPCHMVKVYLSRSGIPFAEYNVSLDRAALKRLIGMGYRTTPLTVIGQEKVVGYSPAKLDAALQLTGIASHPS